MSKVEQALYWPEAMLAEMRTEATRLDRSLSWCAQRAWKLARAQLALLHDPAAEAPTADHLRVTEEIARAKAHYPAPAADGTKEIRKQTLFFPEEMHRELDATAKRLDRSMSWLLQVAWALARTAIAQDPPPA